jgi:hypothetical protein
MAVGGLAEKENSSGNGIVKLRLALHVFPLQFFVA